MLTKKMINYKLCILYYRFCILNCNLKNKLNYFVARGIKFPFHIYFLAILLLSKFIVAPTILDNYQVSFLLNF